MNCRSNINEAPHFMGVGGDMEHVPDASGELGDMLFAASAHLRLIRHRALIAIPWCGRGELNPHGLAATGS